MNENEKKKNEGKRASRGRGCKSFASSPPFSFKFTFSPPLKMNVMVDSLRSWNMHQSILRRVAQDVVDTLQRTPPILVGAVPPPFTAYNPMNA
jgi:hypothetical protein